jgi:hypothetical protein
MPQFAKIVFGPGCPEALRAAIHHAERLAAATAQAHADLRRLPPGGRVAPSAREAWLIGRPAEIEAYVLDVLGDWRGRVMPTRDAVRALEHYLAAMHAGLATRVLGGLRPTCCSLDDLVTRDAPAVDSYDGGWDAAASARTLAIRK